MPYFTKYNTTTTLHFCSTGMPLKLQLQLQLCMIQLTFFSLKNPVLKCYVSVYTCVLYGGGAPSCVLIFLKHCLLSGDMGGRILGQPRPLGFVTPIRASPINPKSKIKTLFKFLKGIFFPVDHPLSPVGLTTTVSVQ